MDQCQPVCSGIARIPDYQSFIRYLLCPRNLQNITNIIVGDLAEACFWLTEAAITACLLTLPSFGHYTRQDGLWFVVWFCCLPKSLTWNPSVRYWRWLNSYTVNVVTPVFTHNCTLKWRSSVHRASFMSPCKLLSCLFLHKKSSHNKRSLGKLKKLCFSANFSCLVKRGLWLRAVVCSLLDLCVEGLEVLHLSFTLLYSSSSYLGFTSFFLRLPSL